MQKWPSQNIATTTLIHKATVGNISFTLTMSNLSLSWFISSPSLSSHEFFTHLWSFLFIKCPPSMAWTSFYQYETCWWCFPCSHCWPMSLSNRAPGSPNTVMDILGTQHREQLKKGVEKGANLIKLAEHRSLRRDVRHALMQFY